MRNVDDIANDYANASTDVERAALIGSVQHIVNQFACREQVDLKYCSQVVRHVGGVEYGRPHRWEHSRARARRLRFDA